MAARKAKEKKERALGERLYLKGERCDSPKCAAVRRPFRPGMHGHKRQRRALSDFGKQLKEKQKFKISYGLDERSLRRLYEIAHKRVGSTAEELSRLLERRLDNAVFKLGLAKSRSIARQLINHGHIYVSGKRVRSPGFLVSVGDVIAFREHSKKLKNLITQEELKNYEAPSWLELNKEKKEGKVRAYPDGDDLKSPFEVNLLIESFSK